MGNRKIPLTFCLPANALSKRVSRQRYNLDVARIAVFERHITIVT